VKLANAKAGELKKEKPAGSKRAIVKKHNVIAVASKPGTQRRSWFTMLMVI